jgi:hypothetical protein
MYGLSAPAVTLGADITSKLEVNDIYALQAEI